MAPTRLPACAKSRARQIASSASTESFPRCAAPNLIEADRSSTSQAVSSRSSVYSRTYGSSSRAVTFQSMCRTSSSGVYSRRPVKSIPAPRNSVRYPPWSRPSSRRMTCHSRRRNRRSAGLVTGSTAAARGYVRHGQRRHHLVQHRVSGDIVAERLVGEHQPMAQDVEDQVGEVAREGVLPAPDERQGARGQDQVDRGSGARPEGDVPGQLAEPHILRPAGGVGQRHRVLDQRRIHIHPLHPGLHVAELIEVDDGLAGRVRRDGPLDDHELLGGTGIVHHDLHHEAVHLGLGQGIGTFRLDRVLGGHDQERLGYPMGLPADGDLLLLHRLQQRALYLGRGPVDLVGQQQVGEHRPEGDLELAAALVVDAGTDDVGRYQIRSELDPVELPADGTGERLDRQRLGQSRYPLDQDVPTGQEGDQQPLQQQVLAHDGLLDLVQDLLHGVRAGGRVAPRLDRGQPAVHRLSLHGSVLTGCRVAGHCWGARSPARAPTAVPMGTANPTPMNVPAAVGLARATTMPTVCPPPLSNGPPELPGFTAASNWMSPARWAPSVVVAWRFSPETTPVVVVRVRPSWLPMAVTLSPTASRSELPSSAGTTTEGSVAGPRTAMSIAGAAAARVAADVLPSAKVTWMASAPFTTCRAVRMVPSALTMTPVPASTVAAPAGTAWMDTTEGATAA